MPPPDEELFAPVMMIHSVTPWVAGRSTPSYLTLARHYRRLVPVAAICERIERHDHIDPSNTIGLHVRAAYPSGFHAEQEMAKFSLDRQVYADIVGWLRASFPTIEGVWLCMNSIDVERSMRALIPDIGSFDKRSIDNTNDAEAVQDALVDLPLMARCRLVASHGLSNFGFFASIIGNGMLLSVKENAGGKVEFSAWKQGEQVAEIALDEAGAATIGTIFGN